MAEQSGPDSCTLIDVRTLPKETSARLPETRIAGTRQALALLIALMAGVCASLAAQGAAGPDAAAPPPSTAGIFPLSQVRAGLTGTAWTVFAGTKPEPMQVEILGVLRGARGPRQDLILAQLHGAKAEYTGVVEGMSGSPVYIDGKLLGALSYRIGQFSKDPIAGITPIEQMLEVRNLPIDEADNRSAKGEIRRGVDQGVGQGVDQGTEIGADVASAALPSSPASAQATFQEMDTPLTMSGFHQQAIELWQKQMAGTTLAEVAAGGMAGGPDSSDQPSKSAEAALEPGSAISAQLVRGDLEMSATCTVTYIDPKQLLACGHPVLQAGTVSLPMTTADVITTLASPLNSFKIINTGATVGAFTEDRDAGIRGVLGEQARMIPMHITLHGDGDDRKLNVEILDQPALSPQAMMVVLFESVLESNTSSATASYHLTGNIDLDGYPAVPLDVWATPSDGGNAPMQLALEAGQRFAELYSNGARRGAMHSINLNVEEIPRRLGVELDGARIVSSDIVHAGDTVEVEATVRPWQQAERNVRIAVRLPARLDTGNVRLLVSDGATLDRTLNQPQLPAKPATLATVLEQARNQHASDRIYVSLLAPDAQAGMGGQTLSGVPLSVANALEPVRTAKDVVLNGESAELAAEAPAGGVLSGFQILSLHIEPGGGLN
jgi:hypothetical protein